MSSLAQFIRDQSSPLEPNSTGEEPRLEKLEGIRAVVFDIYGTLFISAAGDISLADDAARDESIRSAVETGGLELSKEASKLSAVYLDAIRKAQSARRAEAGIEFPEVEIREVWHETLSVFRDNHWLEGDFADPKVIESIAVACECAANPVWPMPNLEETIAELREAGCRLGIISNAQFYTLHLFPAFLGEELDGLGFEDSLQVYSFQLREGKPSQRLYQEIADELDGEGVSAGEVLYIGNDMRNDIWPARETGFRTALFAGDARSLRLREDDPRVAGIQPDLIVTDLSQISTCLG